MVTGPAYAMHTRTHAHTMPRNATVRSAVGQPLLRRIVGRSVGAGKLGHVLDDVVLGLALDILVHLEVFEMATVLQLLVEHCMRQLHQHIIIIILVKRFRLFVFFT